MNTEYKRDPLPDPGVNRWWAVTLDPASRAGLNPIRVSLMESFDNAPDNVSTKRPGRVLHSARTVAQADEIKKTADKILAAVGRYQEYVGEYYIQPRGSNAKQEQETGQ